MAGSGERAHGGAESFPAFFERATGRAPYRYQTELAEAGADPDVLAVPTGSGKTQALIVSWLYRRLRGEAPRRLVYALPMRTLVEQTAEVALDVRDRLGIASEEVPVHVLMGGEDPSDWREHPERTQVIVGTIDMLMSRALNRGYAESRFAWPVSFGLLSNDCRWVFDEVQLMGPARSTSAQLDGLRSKLGTLLPCEAIWASATVDRQALETVDRPRLRRILELPPKDRQGRLAARLDARKMLDRLDLSTQPAATAPRAITDAIVARHEPGTRTLVVVNTVGRAQATARELRKRVGDHGPAVVLVHSRFRPRDRLERMREATAEIDSASRGTIVVATQVIEAGVDMSSKLLATETAPFSSVVQRLGRCNRAGEHDEATVLWLDHGPLDDSSLGAKNAAPYLPADLNATREALEGRIGESLSPAALGTLSVAEHEDEPTMLRRRDLIDLFDTSPDLSGLDVDVAPFIRDDDDRNVSVFFRRLDGSRPTLSRDEQPAPARDELVTVPRSELVDRDCWLFDYVDELWRRVRQRHVAPASTVLLDASAGGYSAERGWDPDDTAPVEPCAPPNDARTPDGAGSDLRSFDGRRQELAVHLAAAMRAAEDLTAELELGSRARAAVVQAAALHDVGKAHAVFQETIRKAIGDDADPAKLWAKSGLCGGPKHRRPGFRHELASALAVLDTRGLLDGSDVDLVAYLVASHHGKVRLSIRPWPDEQRPTDAPTDARFAAGVADGDELPPVETPIGQTPDTTLDLACMELGADPSWAANSVALRDDPSLGPFRLAGLEALVQVADWRAGG